MPLAGKQYLQHSIHIRLSVISPPVWRTSHYVLCVAGTFFIDLWVFCSGVFGLYLKTAFDRDRGFSAHSTFNTTTEVRPLSKAPNPQLFSGHHRIGCPLLRVCVCMCVYGHCCVCALGWVKRRAHIPSTSLFTYFCSCYEWYDCDVYG